MTTKEPLVTIGIPTYNRAASFLRECLESAVNQRYPNIEVIVSDNGSTDGTELLVKSIDSDRIRYKKQKPAVSPPANADYCLAEAKGEYFILLHDDDVLDEDFVEACIEAIGGREIGLVHTGVREIDAKGNVLQSRPNPHSSSTVFDYFKAVLRGRAVTYFCNNLYHTARLRAVGGFTSPVYTYQDVAANIKTIYHYGRVDIEEPKASYRIHGSKLGSTMGLERWSRDSLYLIDVMSELMPEHRDYFHREGKKNILRRCVGKSRRLPSAHHRLLGRFYLYWKFGAFMAPLENFFRKSGNAARRFTPGSFTCAK